MNKQKKERKFTIAKQTLMVFYQNNDNKPIEVIAVVKSVSASGNSRRISFNFRDDKGAYKCLDYNFANILGVNSNDKGVLIKGYGMDMIFSTIDNVNGLIGKNIFDTRYVQL